MLFQKWLFYNYRFSCQLVDGFNQLEGGLYFWGDVFCLQVEAVAIVACQSHSEEGVVLSAKLAFYFAGGNRHLVKHADDAFVCFGTDTAGDKQGGHGVLGSVIEAVGSCSPHL